MVLKIVSSDVAHQTEVGGVEALLGVSHDPQFGPVIAFGLGGMFTEVMDDVALRLPPMAPADAEDMIGELRGAAIMSSASVVAPPADVDVVALAIVALSELVRDWGDRIQGVDVNPLLVRPAGKGFRRRRRSHRATHAEVTGRGPIYSAVGDARIGAASWPVG